MNLLHANIKVTPLAKNRALQGGRRPSQVHEAPLASEYQAGEVQQSAPRKGIAASSRPPSHGSRASNRQRRQVKASSAANSNSAQERREVRAAFQDEEDGMIMRFPTQCFSSHYFALTPAQSVDTLNAAADANPEQLKFMLDEVCER